MVNFFIGDGVKQNEKIQELERRIRELEARPVYVPIYVGAPQPFPCHQPYLPVTYPWQPHWTWGGVGQGTVSAAVSSLPHGGAEISFTN